MEVIQIKNRKFVSIASATRILQYANRNSIEDLVRRRKLNAFKISSLSTSLIPLEELQALSRYHKIYGEKAD